MAYNEELADKVENILQSKPGFALKKMFGGVCYLLQGNMACGVLNDDLIVRTGPEDYEQLLDLPEVSTFAITGKPMKGWVMVSGLNEQKKEDLLQWVERGMKFAQGLPPK